MAKEAVATPVQIANGNGKRLKFISLAEARTAAAIGKIRVIGNLANHNHYEYSEIDAKRIYAALQKELDALKNKLIDQGGKKEIEFKLEG